MVDNYNNYGIYAELVKTGNLSINTKDLNLEELDSHIMAVLNIFRDGIELAEVQGLFVEVIFIDNQVVPLALPDYVINLMMWRSILATGHSICSRHLFFNDNTTSRYIKDYIDTHIVIPNIYTIETRKLNNIIADCLEIFKELDDFSFFLANTINLEDDISLMLNNQEAYDIYHTSVADVPLQDVIDVGEKRTSRLIDIITKTKSHCLYDFFRAEESINPKQYREYAVNIGTKPNGTGGVFEKRIDSSYIVGGLKDIPSMFIESSGGRTAQILSKSNVGLSGEFARLLGLNSSDTVLHKDPNYVCDSANFQILEIKDHKTLKLLSRRYYRLQPDGMEYLLEGNELKLIGSKIYLRSPMTCSSKSRNDGVCYRCYGPLAYTNNTINIGKMAAEMLSSQLTQRLLSAKHLLVSKIEKVTWSYGFDKFLDVDTNIVFLLDDINFKGYKMVIERENIATEGDDTSGEVSEYSEYITRFTIIDPDGQSYDISSETEENIYISIELNEAIREYGDAVDEKIHLDLDRLVGMPIFLLKIENNELSETLDMLKSIINKQAVTSETYDRHGLLQAYMDTTIEGGLNIQLVHGEIILANQLRRLDDVLYDVDWSTPDPEYTILTLHRALKDNKSIIVTMNYKELSRALYNPLSFRQDDARKPSFMDLFFMNSPMKYLNSDNNITYKNNIVEDVKK